MLREACRPALLRAATSAAGLMAAGSWWTATILVTTMTSTDSTPCTLSRMLWIKRLSMGQHIAAAWILVVTGPELEVLSSRP